MCLLWVPWWRHQMEMFFVLLTLCEGSPPVTGEFSSQRPLKRSFDAFFDLRMNKQNRDAGDLRRHCTHYDVTLMKICSTCFLLVAMIPTYATDNKVWHHIDQCCVVFDIALYWAALQRDSVLLGQNPPHSDHNVIITNHSSAPLIVMWWDRRTKGL